MYSINSQKTMTQSALRNLVLILIFGLVTNLGFAQQSGLNSLEDLGFTQVTRDGRREYQLSGSEYPITILQNPHISPVNLGLVNELLLSLRRLENIQPQRVSITLRPTDSTVVIAVTSVIAGEQGQDVARLMPEGIVFRLQDVLMYDFSMIVDNLRLRLRGQFFGEQELLDKIGRVVANPAQYLLSQDSEYVFRLMLEIQEQNQLLLTSLQQATTRVQTLQQELSILRDGLILFNTRGVFGSWNDFDRQMVQAIVAWRQANPQATRREAQDWAREQGYSPSSRLVQAILVAYFNQIE
jgi:hypothetical protein